MDNSNDIVFDEWQIKLDQKEVEVKECQISNSLESCTPCDKFFDCELRKKYVVAVYSSMNKGSTGGFEF
jgi:hypothetical protein